MAKIATFTIDEHGNVESDMSGYHGKGCHAVQDLISNALGGEVTKEVRKAEFNKPLTKTTCIKR
jgi:hypothetical protein